jgi:hypothetical protein
MNTLTVRQIFLYTDLRKGEFALEKYLNDAGITAKGLQRGEVFIFVNRKRNIMKAVSRQGIHHDRAVSRFDLNSKRNNIFEHIGRYFGMEYHVPPTAHRKLVEDLEEHEERMERERDRRSVHALRRHRERLMGRVAHL